MPSALTIGISKQQKKAEAECVVKSGPLKHPPPGWGVANFVECLKLGRGGGVI